MEDMFTRSFANTNIRRREAPTPIYPIMNPPADPISKITRTLFLVIGVSILVLFELFSGANDYLSIRLYY